jgi:glyoxylase-like metal-dependent hydrolase (beta-lactamase superfamily II)
MLQLRHPGPAHTDGDLYVYMPSWRTIVAGGLVFNEVLPEINDSYIDPWIDALQEMEDLDAELIVPGHGKPGGKQIIIQAKHYLILLKRHVNYQLDEGRSLKETIHHVSGILKDKYGHWQHPERMVDNIRRAYIEYSAKRGT